MTDNNIRKKILCNNIVQHNYCRYGNNCSYAHSLSEQRIDKSREQAIKLITGNKHLGNIDLLCNNLLDTLTIFTKLCHYCVNKKCLGGYNCKHGACDIHYCICYEDFMYGKCQKIKCNFIHLTNRGLVPYTIQKRRNRARNLENNINNHRNINLFKLYINCNTKSSSETDSYEDEDVASIMEYLHS